MATEAKPRIQFGNEDDLSGLEKALIEFESSKEIKNIEHSPITEYYVQLLWPALEELEKLENEGKLNIPATLFLGDILRQMYSENKLIPADGILMTDLYNAYKRIKAEINRPLNKEEKEAIRRISDGLPVEIGDELNFTGNVDEAKAMLLERAIIHDNNNPKEKISDQVFSALHSHPLRKIYQKRQPTGLTNGLVMNKPMKVNEGLTNGCEKESHGKKEKEKKKWGLLKKIAAIASVGLTLSSLAISALTYHEPPNWEHMYQNLLGLDNSVDSQAFLDTFLGMYNASDWNHYNATSELVSATNGTFVVESIKNSMMSPEEFNILPQIEKINKNVTDYPHLWLMLSENNNLQNRINASERNFVIDTLHSFQNLNYSEQNSTPLQLMNKTEHKFVIPNKNNKNTNQQILSPEEYSAIEEKAKENNWDGGDLWQHIVELGKQKGINLNNTEEAKILWGTYARVFPLLDKGASNSETNNILNYIFDNFSDKLIEIVNNSNASFEKILSTIRLSNDRYGLNGIGTPLLKPPSRGSDWNYWMDKYWNGVFYHLNNTTENKNFTRDLINGMANLSNNDTYNAFHKLVVSGRLNPMVLARYFAANMIDDSEVPNFARIISLNSSYTNKTNSNLTIVLAESEAFKDGINASEAAVIENIFKGWNALTSLERKATFFRPHNVTNMPTITNGWKDPDYNETNHWDTGDLLYWLFTNLTKQFNLDPNNTTIEKLLLSEASVYDGLFTKIPHSWMDDFSRDSYMNKGSWNGSVILAYIPAQIKTIGLKNLTKIANVQDGLMFLQHKLKPSEGKLMVDLGSSGAHRFQENIFWIDGIGMADDFFKAKYGSYNVYNNGTKFWEAKNYNSTVVGKIPSKALTSLESKLYNESIHANDSAPQVSNFSEWFTREFQKMEKGEVVEGDCEQISATIDFLLLTNNLWIDKNGLVTNKSEEGVLPLVPIAVYMNANGNNAHIGTAYLDKNASTNGVDIVLSDNDWTKFQSGDPPKYALTPGGYYWYELESIITTHPNSSTIHDGSGLIGTSNINVLQNLTKDYVWGHFLYNVSSIGAKNIHQRTNYSLILDYATKAQEGAIKYAHGSDAYGILTVFDGRRYDLLYKDNVDVPVPEFPHIAIPTAVVMSLGLYATSYSKRKRRKKN